MHNPIINTLNQHVRFRSMTLRRVLRNRRISTLSLYVSNTLMLVYKGDIKTKRGKCISMVVFRMGILCAACHVCRSGIRVSKLNQPSPKNKNHKSHHRQSGQSNHWKHLSLSFTLSFSNGESGDDTDLSLRSAWFSHVDLPPRFYVGRLTSIHANLANWSCRLVSSPYGFSRSRDITKLRISQAPPAQRRTSPF